MQRAVGTLLLLLAAAGVMPTDALSTTAAVNPIRRVVTMLQMMQKKVTAEGEKEKELFEKFMCYCKTSGGDLEKSIADAGTKVPELQSDIEAAEATKAQLEADVKKHKEDREAAEEAMKEATAIREKEKAAFEKETAEFKANVAAIEKAVAALEKGMAGGFLQTSAAGVLRRLADSDQKLQEEDRDELLSFLTAGQGEEYAPQSGEIVGILKQMMDEMGADLKDVLEAEEKAKKDYEELMAAKKKEKEICTKLIEEKLTRIGELAVEIVEMKNDLSETEQALIEDQQFLADLKKNCATKEAEWEERCKTRSEELLALADTIKILNDDDALDLFKKTLPSPSLLQVQVTSAEVRARALRLIQAANPGRPQLDLIQMALRGKKIGFEKVITMIDEMVVLLQKEQTIDDTKKDYCETEFDVAEDEAKELEHSIADLEKGIAADNDGLATLADEIQALVDGIKALDKAVAEATAQRKQENEDYTDLMASDSAAKEIIKFAKNRLNKFYNPKLYKPPPKRELTEEERITVNMGGTLAPTAPPAGIAGTGIAVLASISVHGSVAPPPPPETFGAYAKKSEESGGVIAMMDLLVKELDKEMTEAETEEKLAQEDYEKMMADSAAKRTEDSKAITDKTAAKAELEADLQAKEDAKASSEKDLMATLKYIESLHAECDWLLKYYDTRKEARASEIDALGKAKAVLSGADYSLLQTGHALKLRRPQ